MCALQMFVYVQYSVSYQNAQGLELLWNINKHMTTSLGSCVHTLSIGSHATGKSFIMTHNRANYSTVIHHVLVLESNFANIQLYSFRPEDCSNKA